MKHKDLLTLLVPFLIVSMAWVIFNIYHSSINSTITDSLNIQLSPIAASFDNQAIESMRNRRVFDPAYEFGATSAAILEIEPAPQASTPAIPLQSDENASSSVGALLQ